MRRLMVIETVTCDVDDHLAVITLNPALVFGFHPVEVFGVVRGLDQSVVVRVVRAGLPGAVRRDDHTREYDAPLPLPGS